MKKINLLIFVFASSFLFSCTTPNIKASSQIKLPIILIGPISVGKSTVARELSSLLDIRNVSMDQISIYYYLKAGFDEKKSKNESSEEDNLYAISEIIKDFPNEIIDFGAGHPHFEDEKNLQKAINILKPYENIILLLPSKERKKAIEILRKNMEKLLGEPPLDIALEYATKGFDSYSLKNLAKIVVYTEDRNPKVIAEEIIQKLHHK